MKDYRIEITVRNNRIIEMMRMSGFTTAAELCRAYRLDPVIVGQYINLKKSPLLKTGGWNATALKLADALYCLPGDLWTEIQQKKVLKTNCTAIEVEEQELIGLARPQTPLQLLENKEVKNKIYEVLGTFDIRNEDIIKMKFGLSPYFRGHSLREIGNKYNISVERVRQIKNKALRRMRRPGLKKHFESVGVE